MAWTTKRIEKIRLLAEQGLSAAQIADKFGDVTRNAVCGAAHRNRIYFKGSLSGAFNAEPRKPRKRSPHPKLRMIIGTIMANGNVTLEQLEAHHCRWPIGMPGDPDFVFCGENKEANISYCAGHASIAYRCQEVTDAYLQKQTRPSFRSYGAIRAR